MSSDEFSPADRIGEHLERFEHSLESGDVDEATDAVHEIFDLAAEWCESHPSPDFELSMAAVEREESGDWAGAESIYKQVLELPDLTPATEYGAHKDLATLCLAMGRSSEALEHAGRATAAARPAEIPLLLAMALATEARCLIECGKFRAAQHAVTEALSGIADDERFQQMHASLLIQQAECAIQFRELASADQQLSQALAWLEPLAQMEMAAGVHGDLARYWAATARLHAVREENNDAIAAWRNALQLCRQITTQPHCRSVYNEVRVASMLEGLAEALDVDSAEEASRVRAERREILVKIGLPELA